MFAGDRSLKTRLSKLSRGTQILWQLPDGLGCPLRVAPAELSAKNEHAFSPSADVPLPQIPHDRGQLLRRARQSLRHHPRDQIADLLVAFGRRIVDLFQVVALRTLRLKD